MEISNAQRTMICTGNQCLMILDAVESLHISIPVNPAVTIAALTAEMEAKLLDLSDKLIVMTKQQAAYALSIATVSASREILKTTEAAQNDIDEANKAGLTVDMRRELSSTKVLKSAIDRQITKAKNEIEEQKELYTEKIEQLKEDFKYNTECFETFIKEVTTGYLSKDGYGNKFIDRKCNGLEDLVNKEIKPNLEMVVKEIANAAAQCSCPAVIGSATDNVLYKVIVVGSAIIKIAKLIKEIGIQIKDAKDIVEELRIPDFATIPGRIKNLNLSGIISFVGDDSIMNEINSCSDSLENSSKEFDNMKKSVADEMHKNYTCIDEKDNMYAQYYYEVTDTDVTTVGADIYKKFGDKYLYKYHIDYPDMPTEQILAMTAAENEKLKEKVDAVPNIKTNLKIIMTPDGKAYISQ